MTHENVSRYSSLAQILHWLTVLLVLAAFVAGPGGSEERIYAVARDGQRELHETLGICVLALTLLRLAWRWRDTQPAPSSEERWMAATARWVQFSLFGLLFLVPLTAIFGAWLEGHPLTLLLGIKVAPLLGPAHALGANVVRVHQWLGDAIIWLAGLHALAGIYHHVIRKDEVLLSMLPRMIGTWLSHKE
jgi:cytochrome b561